MWERKEIVGGGAPHYMNIAMAAVDGGAVYIANFAMGAVDCCVIDVKQHFVVGRGADELKFLLQLNFD